jgi:hypothetical protein
MDWLKFFKTDLQEKFNLPETEQHKFDRKTLKAALRISENAITENATSLQELENSWHFERNYLSRELYNQLVAETKLQIDTLANGDPVTATKLTYLTQRLLGKEIIRNLEERSTAIITARNQAIYGSSYGANFVEPQTTELGAHQTLQLPTKSTKSGIAHQASKNNTMFFKHNHNKPVMAPEPIRKKHGKN